MSNLQAKLCKLMTQQKMTVLDIATETELHKNTLYSIVQGDTIMPTAQTLHLIAKSLGVSLESLLSDEEDIEIGQEKALSPIQMLFYVEAASLTINTMIKRNLNLPTDRLMTVIKKVFIYGLKADPPSIDARFINYQLDKFDN